MSALRRFFARLSNFAAGRRDVDRLKEEIEEHLALQTAENLRAGLPSDEARRQALLKFGGVESVKEEYREERGFVFLDTLFQDIRYAFRVIRKSPGFTAIAVLTLALGIGANTAIFSVVNAVLLRPLGYPQPGQLVSVSETNIQAGRTNEGMSYPAFTELVDHNDSFSEVGGLAGHALTLTGRGEPSEVSTVVITPDFLSVFQTKPLLGRTFLPQDGNAGAAAVVVVSENLWRSRLSGDPGIVGDSITLDMRPYTVIGIMPAGFRTPFFNQTEQVWIPLVQDPLFSGWRTKPQRDHWMPVIARVKPGVSIQQVKAEMDTTSARFAKEFPAERGWQIQILPLQQVLVGDARNPLILLLCAVALVLLIACVNIANLLLARATSRSKEIGVRIALGADTKRITRQLLTESAILGLLGGIAGVLLAYWGVSSLATFLPSDLPQIHSVRVDGVVLGFALVLSLVSGSLFGLAPTLFTAWSNPQASLREGPRAGQAKRPRRARSLLASTEVALAVVLLVAAGLLMRSFSRLISVSPGFDPTSVVKAEVSLPQFEYSTPAQWTRFSTDLMTRLQADPGMQNSAIGIPLPLANDFVNLPFTIAGSPPPPQGSGPTGHYVAASPNYFSVMRIPLLSGRLFTSGDVASTPNAALINDTLAKRYFPNQNPLGRQLIFGFPPNNNTVREIVGIVGDTRDASLGEKPAPTLYVPFAQAPFWGCEVVVRSTLTPSAISAAIRTEAHNIDKNLPVTSIEPLPQAITASVAQPKFRVLLIGVFGAMALVLAAVGLFGVVSYSVSRRTQEIGIRLALGASSANVLRLVLAESARLVVVGLAVGIPAALVLTRFLSTFLFDIHPADPLTFIGVGLLLLIVSLVAAYLPARRATHVDSVVALRYE